MEMDCLRGFCRDCLRLSNDAGSRPSAGRFRSLRATLDQEAIDFGDVRNRVLACFDPTPKSLQCRAQNKGGPSVGDTGACPWGDMIPAGGVAPGHAELIPCGVYRSIASGLFRPVPRTDNWPISTLGGQFSGTGPFPRVMLVTDRKRSAAYFSGHKGRGMVLTTSQAGE